MTIQTFQRVFATIFLLSVVAACGKSSDEPKPTAPTELQLSTVYEEKVEPIVSEKCGPCHATGSKLNSYATEQQVLRERKDFVLDRVSRLGDGVMPPVKSGKSLSAEEMKVLRSFLSQ